ncbi:MAG: hypothetical protein O3A85_14170 [Proteobacteria bacterium]|nr:hypothetical protein [Pseudomonadota bacterium]
MTPADFTIEKTAAGQQYVIPGTERILKLKRRRYKTETTPGGDQFLIPGTEPISTKEYLARLAERPLRSRRGQIGLRGAGLFGTCR